MFSCRTMGINMKRRLYEGVAVPSALCEADMYSMYSIIEEIKCNGDEMS